MDCEICEVLKKDDFVIHQTKFWRITLAPQQTYLGRCYVTLLRHCPDLAELTQKEWEDSIQIVKDLEKAIRRAFTPDVFNWFCQMNDAFQSETPQPHVHWHVRPRYKQKVEFSGQTFEDLEFGHRHSYTREEVYPETVLQDITNKIKKNYLLLQKN